MSIFNKELDSSGYIAKLNRKAKDYSKTTPEDNLKVRRWHKTYVLYNEIAKLSNFDSLSNSHKDAIVSAGLSYLIQIVDMKLDMVLKVIELTGDNTFEHWISTVLKEETPVVDFNFN